MALVAIQSALAKRSARRWVAAAALGALIFLPGVVHLAQLSWRDSRLARRERALKADQAQLLKERDLLQSSPTHVEDLIRSTYKVAQPGELVVPMGSVDERGKNH